MTNALTELNAKIATCRACTRLVLWREQVARDKVRRYRDQQYWGRPVPGFGDPQAQVMVVGLAPAAHGANRTGRMFTGDSSGDWLIEALWETGFANQPSSTDADDGLRLDNLYLTAAVHCAPPDNRPRPDETRACAPYLEQEFAILRPPVIIALGKVAQDAIKRMLKKQGLDASSWTFAHGSRCDVGGHTLIASYHPSRQNTQTGKLTQDMLKMVFQTAQDILAR
ncbi:uracil-DNA glycosylase [Sulfobacillus harzensis]|uniref:Type-5 uracil-DNA glycosylase n=1 Tax=Sulfobacillus harzensis TaxID=2729629 RepID=A0A7Y0L681_9FIRM|nr:uracil-DNA glycosylase [Sulfobacillus harzensis]NMP24074.1 uracil-DNA glycosylase [Sulfobacillus harzensis]